MLLWVGASHRSSTNGEVWLPQVCDIGDLTILICRMTSGEHVFKRCVTLCVEAPHSKLPPCHDTTRPRDSITM